VISQSNIMESCVELSVFRKSARINCEWRQGEFMPERLATVWSAVQNGVW
jgi:hypothetical protein